jgi:hypothetical protein
MRPIDLIARMLPGDRSLNDGNGLAVMQPRLDAMTSEECERSDLRLCELTGRHEKGRAVPSAGTEGRSIRRAWS